MVAKTTNTSAGLGRANSRRGVEESPLAKWLLITIALGFCFIFLLLPLLNVFV